MAIGDGRGIRAGAFALEIDGQLAGYVRKVDLGKLKGEVVTNNLGPTNRQKKHIAKMSWDAMSFEIGLGMGQNIYDWINASFKLNHTRKNGAFIMFDHNYNVVRRCDFTDAHLTEVGLGAYDAKGKEAIYMTCKIQPETVRYSNGSGKLPPTIGQNQKLHANTNFDVDIPGIDSQFIRKVELPKFTVKVTEDARGKFIESQYVATSNEVSDFKVTLGAQSYKELYDDSMSFLVMGERAEAKEKTITINVKGPDAKKDIAVITMLNCGYKEVQFSESLEAAKDNTSECVATFYVEELNFEKLVTG
jgi:hypothetical protein